jgi:hypothetical protein
MPERWEVNITVLLAVMIKLARILTVFIVLASVFFVGKSKAQTQDMPVFIIANSGPFGAIEQAAESENKVNFWDDNLEDDDACTESFAAVELQHFLSACTGIPLSNIQLTSTKQLPQAGYVFVIGNRRSNPLIKSLSNKNDNLTPFTSPESFRIHVLAHGSASVCIIEGNGRIGTLYGVYAYLERLGMRFFGLGEQDTVYPAGKVAIPSNPLDMVENPAFMTRGFYAWENRGNKEFFLWMARNRMNFWTSAQKEIPLLKKLGMHLAIGAHDVLSNFLNPSAKYPNDTSKTYFQAHPEWFGMRDGKRIGDVGGWSKDGRNICTSNDEAVAELSKNFVNGLIDGVWRYADVVNFWMLDGSDKWCDCEKCKAIGSYSDRLMRLVYQVNKEVQKARKDSRLKRNVHLTTLAYSDTMTPPTKSLPEDFDYESCSVTFYPIQRCYVHAMNDSNCAEINRWYRDSYLGWAPHKDGFYQGTLFVGEYYNVSNYKSLPVLYSRIMAEDIPWYYKTGARNFQYMHTLTKGWGTWTLNQYMLARMLWNPALDVNEMLNDYFQKCYPTTTERTRSFYGHLEDAFRNITPLKTNMAIHFNRGSDPFAMKHFHYEPYHPSTDDGPDLLEIIESFHLARSDIDAATLECKDQIETKRLLDDERRFAYGEDIVDFLYHTARTMMFDKAEDSNSARREFEKVEKAAENLRRYKRDFIETFICPDGGFEATQLSPEKFKSLKLKYGRVEMSNKPEINSNKEENTTVRFPSQP